MHDNLCAYQRNNDKDHNRDYNINLIQQIREDNRRKLAAESWMFVVQKEITAVVPQTRELGILVRAKLCSLCESGKKLSG